MSNLEQALNTLKNCKQSTLAFKPSGYKTYSDYGGTTKGYSTIDIGPLTGLKIHEVDAIRKLLLVAGYDEVVEPKITYVFSKASGFLPISVQVEGLYIRK